MAEPLEPLSQLTTLDETRRGPLASLEDDVLLIGRRVQHVIPDAMGALVNRDPGLARLVVQTDDQIDAEVYTAEERLRDELVQLRSDPSEARLLFGLQRALLEIERTGDGCVNLARIGASLVDLDHGVAPELRDQFMELGRRAERAFRTGLDAFGHRRVQLDRVLSIETEIDMLRDGLTNRLIDHAVRGREETCWSIQMTLASRHLERIGDHAVNIARQGVYVTTGTKPPRSWSASVS